MKQHGDNPNGFSAKVPVGLQEEQPAPQVSIFSFSQNPTLLPRPSTGRPVRRPQVGFHRASSSYPPHTGQVISNTPPLTRSLRPFRPHTAHTRHTHTLQWTHRMEVDTDSMPGVPEEIMQLSGAEFFFSDSLSEALERCSFNLRPQHPQARGPASPLHPPYPPSFHLLYLN